MKFRNWFQFSELGELVRRRSFLSLCVGPLAFFIILFAPFELPGLEPQAKTFLAIFVWVACQWLLTTVPMFMTGIMGVSLACLFEISSPSQALAPFAHPIIFLFLGGFLLARAMEELGFDKKLSMLIISHPAVKGSFKKTFIAILVVTSFFSMWISNTATTAMMLPIMLGLLRSLDIKDQNLKSSLLIAMAYAATIGGLGTPMGSPPNIIAVGMLKEIADITITFLDWMIMGIPLVLVSLFLLIMLVFKKIPRHILESPIDVAALGKLYSSKFTFAEKIIIITFSTTVFFWFIPSIAGLISPDSPVSDWMNRVLDPSIVVMLTVTPLFFLPFSGEKKILTSESLKNIDWSSLLLFGSGLSLGGLLFSTGIAGLAGNTLIQTLESGHFYWAMVLVISATVFFTEFTSNTASANILLPIVIAATIQMGISPTGPSLMVALACNLAFMLPVATPPNAIVFGSGEVHFKDLLRWGLIMNIIGITLISITLNFY